MTQTIIVGDHSTRLDASEIQPAVNACIRQVKEHLAPAWGLPDVTGLSEDWKEATEAAEGHPDHQLLILADNADQAGALGYHTKDKHGKPIGFVFIETIMNDGDDWRVTLSHELCEQLVNPQLNAQVEHDSKIWPQEACDAVQGSSYEIDGIPVSDFVLPSYFEAGSEGPWDHLGVLDGPFTIAKGGYSSLFYNGKWNTVWGMRGTEKAARKHSRRERIQDQ